MLKIENIFYNAREIRKLSRTNRDNLIITYVNGDEDFTNYYCNDYAFKQIVKEWEKCLK